MIIKVYFEEIGDTIPFANQHVLNGIVYKRFFNGEKTIHNNFSPYSVSSIQGCIMNEEGNGLTPLSRPYIMFSSQSEDIVLKFITGVEKEIEKGDKVFFGRRVAGYSYHDFDLGASYDIVKTISPVLLRDDKHRQSCCTDNGWSALLKAKTKAKLEKMGIFDETFDIVFDKKNPPRRKGVFVGNTFNPCTTFVALVKGQRKTRLALYNMGIGQSTGSGFGAVSILK